MGSVTHNWDKKPLSNKMHECPVCEIKTTTRSNMIRHLGLKHPEKPILQHSYPFGSPTLLSKKQKQNKDYYAKNKNKIKETKQLKKSEKTFKYMMQFSSLKGYGLFEEGVGTNAEDEYDPDYETTSYSNKYKDKEEEDQFSGKDLYGFGNFDK